MKIWKKTCIQLPINFRFHLIPVNVDRVYIFCVNERTQKKTLNRCLCPQKNERQQKKPVTHGIRNKKKRKNKKFTIPYHQNLEQNVVPENVSNLKNMNSIANCKLISKVSDHLSHVLRKREHTFMTSTKKGCGGGVWKSVTCLRILYYIFK